MGTTMKTVTLNDTTTIVSQIQPHEQEPDKFQAIVRFITSVKSLKVSSKAAETEELAEAYAEALVEAIREEYLLRGSVAFMEN
jgi:L-arabinose isomerase